MPGICGVIDLSPAAELPLLSAMARPLAPHAWFALESRQPTSGVQLAAVSLDWSGRTAHLAESADGAQICILDGEFYNRPELQRALGADGAAAVSDAAILLAGWTAGGKSFLRQINGSFAAVLWDGENQTATLISDRFGSRPLYYAQAGSRILFASRIKSLMADPAVSRHINPRGLAQFFTFGIYLRDDTSLSSVRVLPAGACWSFDAHSGAIQRDAYHYWSESYATQLSSRDQWIERIGTALHESVQRQTTGIPGLGLSLSGGLDARSILASIDVQRTPLKSVCLGIRGSLDHRCAEQLARIAGCANHSHVLDTHFLGEFRRHLDDMVALTDGQYLSQCIVMPTLPLYRELGIEVLLRGHAGELMHMYKAYSYSLDAEALALRSTDDLCRWLLRRLQAYMLDGVQRPVFAPPYHAELAQLAGQSLRADIEETCGTSEVPQRIWQLFVTQRLRRETVLSLVKFRSVAETRLPFLDNELVPLLLAAPAELKLGEDLQEAILRRFRPEFLRVVNANTGTRVGAGPWARKLSSLYLRAMGKLGVPGYQPYERLGLWLRRELVDVVRDVLLDEQTLDRGLYDADGIRAVVANHLAGRNHTFLIMALMVFELGQRYLDETQSAQDESRCAAVAS